jgi:hypothetical protein
MAPARNAVCPICNPRGLGDSASPRPPASLGLKLYAGENGPGIVAPPGPFFLAPGKAGPCRIARYLHNSPQAYGFRFRPRQLYRQPTRGGFSTVGTIVTIHRCELRDRSSWTDRTMPKNLDPFKLSSAVRPLYWARRQRWASTELLVSTVCTMTSSGRCAQYQSNVN